MALYKPCILLHSLLDPGIVPLSKKLVAEKAHLANGDHSYFTDKERLEMSQLPHASVLY